MNDRLLNSLASPVNHVAQAYEARTTQLEGQRKERQAAEAMALKERKAEDAAAQQQRDNDMLKVFEFAGDGMVAEAQTYAQQKGLQIPNEIYANADFSKGLATAGTFYGDDPAGAQRFTMAWMQTTDIPDYGQRVLRASQLAGQPLNPDDREFQRQLKMEAFKNQLKSGNARRELFSDATKESIGGFDPDPEAGRKAVESYDQFFGTDQPSPMNFNFDIASQGLMGDIPASVQNNNPGNMRPINSTTGFQKFQTPEAGVKAMYNDLAVKISGQSNAMKSRYGENYVPTLANLIATWAPPEENNTANYVMFVSQKTGIAPEQQLTLQDIERIMPAMIEMEGGAPAKKYYNGSSEQTLQSQIPSGLPQGTVMIGTRNGAPVYQSPDGRKFIDDGNP